MIRRKDDQIIRPAFSQNRTNLRIKPFQCPRIALRIAPMAKERVEFHKIRQN